MVLHSEQWRKQFRGYCHRQWGVYLAMTIDAYSFTAGDVIGIDSNGYASGTSETPTLSPALSVTTTDLVYAACIINGTAGTVSAGTGFAMRYSKPIIGGQSYGIAAEDYTNESSNITPSFSFADSTSWGLNAIAFRAAIQSVTIVGPNQGLYSTQQEFSVSLAGPAGAGGIVVSLASTNGSDTFQATSSGSSITSITIPANALSTMFTLLQVQRAPATSRSRQAASVARTHPTLTMLWQTRHPTRSRARLVATSLFQ